MRVLPRGWPSGGLWSHPDFLRLWGAQIVSAFGSRITRTALPILALLTLQATPTEVAILSALGVAPGLLVGLFMGGHVDRTARRPLLIGADLLRALLLLTLPLAAWLGVLSMPQLYLVAAAVGAATTLFQIADNSYLPTLVDKALLVEANARLEASESVAEAAGPGLAGVLVQWLTAPVAIGVDALSYVWSALWLGRIRTPEKPAAATGAHVSVLGDIVTGFRACLSHPLIRPVLIAEAVMYFFGGFFLALYMVFTLETLGLTPATVGLIIGVGGVGAFLGALLARPMLRRGLGPAMGFSLLVGQGANLLIPLAREAGAWSIPLLVLQQLLGDALLGAYVIHALSLRQWVMDSEVLGRANATFHVVTGLLLSLGALLAGPLVDVLGMGPTLWIGAGGGLLAVPLLLGGSPLTSRD
ncbi:major facilitator superfamily MFS_1 [Cystobacter fuscus DSM 2262]|uniref:Major facilitator superfamily MFS_1 n=1 Tax=Cystobacter fuscus (strain ATCC 25194 / DSM 2262 / NBRC 100088 / M29) TaxID=1242864 RepID=S9R3B3_CYSF2|nr:MFS transporter [Cystobacter fuscus]EPX63388.1 major facilitator superfamily MFS_1 [Cystobacter fuscus DSM 2262]